MTLNPKEEAVLALIEDPVYENYFFNKVSDVKWFETLRKIGYFNPEKAPGPIPVDAKGYVTIPVWNVLPYLEKISKQVNDPGGEKYIDELLTIIREVTEYHKTTKALDNYNTWSYFVRILLNIPNDLIPVEIIELVPCWLDSKYPSTSLGDDIALELLSKFLSEKPTKDDTTKAEKIIESMLGIKWKEESTNLVETLAGIKEEPYLVVDRYWLTESLVNMKNIYKLGDRCSDELIFMVADKLKTIFGKQMNPSGFDVIIENTPYRVIVMHTRDFEFECFGGKIDEEKRIKLEGTEKFFRKMLYIPERQFEFVITNCRDENNFADQMISNLKTTKLEQIENDLSNRIVLFYKNVFNDFSYIWYGNLTEMPHWLGSSSAKELLTLILRELIVAKIRSDREVGKKVIDMFLDELYQYPLFGRFSLFIIGEFWSDYQNVYEKLLNEPSAAEWFDDLSFETEMYILLEKNVNKFSPFLKEKLKEIIDNGPQRSLPVENKEKYINYWKQKWFSALKADTKFAELYEHYRQLSGVEEHIHFKEPEAQTRSGPGPSPLSTEQILAMPNNETANFLSTFKTKDWWEGPTEDALSEALTQAVKAQPEKFVNDLKLFTNTSYKYVVDILCGLRESWGNKKTFDWSKLLEFMVAYINRDNFWQDKLPITGDHWKPNHPWVISTIGSLMQDGTKDDAWAFDKSHNTIAQEIISIILTDEHIVDLKSSEDKREPDYISDIHNTPLGDIIIALLYLSLRIARLRGKEQKAEDLQDKRWSNELKGLYEKTFTNDIVEAYTAFGQYLPYLMYLDKKWAEQKIKELKEPKQGIFRKAFMTGYLNTIRVYDNIYLLESMQSHYEWALETTFARYTSEQLVHHITVGYLRGHPDLFKKMSGKWNPSQMLETIDFFWRESKYLLKTDVENRDAMIKRVIDFWQKVYDRYKDKSDDLSEDDKKILSNVTKLSVYFEKIDKGEFEWLMLSAPYVHIEGNERWLLEYLDKLKDEGDKITVTKYILRIILKILESKIFGYAQEYIKPIIIYAYDLGDIETKQMANDTCNILGVAGFEYLRPVYEKYNK